MADSMVRAMTWNVWGRFGPRWQDRQPGILATLQRWCPDVLALQVPTPALVDGGLPDVLTDAWAEGGDPGAVTLPSPHPSTPPTTGPSSPTCAGAAEVRPAPASRRAGRRRAGASGPP